MRDPQEIIKDFNWQHGYREADVDLVAELRHEGFDDEAIAKFIGVLGRVCKWCWDRGPHCQCMNDE